MIASTHASKPSLNCPGRKIRRTIRQSYSLKVKASDVDSYGDYDLEQNIELPANLAGMKSNSTELDVSDEEFEKLYRWYLS